jgi:putative salt-induced outer membrane protein
MIEAAMATEDPAKVNILVEIARQTNPDDRTEIDAMAAEFRTAQAARRTAAAAEAELALREASLFANWSGQGQVGAFQSSGNSAATGLTAQLQLKREGIDWEHNLRASADYRRSNGQTDREQFSLSYEPRLELGDELFAYALGQVERNRFQGFSSRYAISGGLGYKVLDDDGLSLSVQAGPAWRQTNLVTGLSESSIAVLAGLDFDWRLSDRIKLTQDANAVAEGGGRALAIIDSRSTSINLVTGLEGRITDKLTARLSYTLEYDSNPPVGAVSTDTATRFTFVYGF